MRDYRHRHGRRNIIAFGCTRKMQNTNSRATNNKFTDNTPATTLSYHYITIILRAVCYIAL